MSRFDSTDSSWDNCRTSFLNWSMVVAPGLNLNMTGQGESSARRGPVTGCMEENLPMCTRSCSASSSRFDGTMWASVSMVNLRWSSRDDGKCKRSFKLETGRLADLDWHDFQQPVGNHH